jgi:hypothetical protein
MLHATTGAGGGQGRAPEAPLLDAIAAYDLVAPGYRDLSQRRRAYLDAVDSEILRRLPSGAASLIDVGAGDGRRALQIAQQAGVPRVVLVEPSDGMRGLIPAGSDVWNERMEALRDAGPGFDVVLGGLIFLDVLNRYNLAECGVGVVLRRLLSSHNGDVPVKWRIGGDEVNTQGYVFSANEMDKLLRDAGLRVVAREVLNYRTGRREPWSVAGNLLYVLRSDDR